MKKITEVSSLEEGFELKIPFVVRGIHLPCNLRTCEQRAQQHDMDLFGYGKGGTELWLKASEAFAQFRKDQLSMNIVDAPFPVLLDHELPPILLEAVKKSRKKICLTLTRDGSYTPLHIDPDHGGGWMYLQQGSKKWQLIDSRLNPYPPNEAGEVEDPPKDWDADCLFESTINAGDFLFFTSQTPHRVWTYGHSFGVSGYAK